MNEFEQRVLAHLEHQSAALGVLAMAASRALGEEAQRQAFKAGGKLREELAAITDNFKQRAPSL
jgi:hypothetical protein